MTANEMKRQVFFCCVPYSGREPFRITAKNLPAAKKLLTGRGHDCRRYDPIRRVYVCGIKDYAAGDIIVTQAGAVG